MRSTVRIVFADAEHTVHLTEADPEWSVDEARHWLDQKFVAYECEPVRAIGKVLTVDKLLAIAIAVGAPGFDADPDLQRAFALAAEGATGRPRVTVDVGQRSVTY